MTFDIRGASAFVTGGGSGIGAAIVESLLDEGARVVAADIDEAGLASTLDRLRARGEVHAVVLDVTDRSALAAVAQDMEDRFGGTDILCNNAGTGILAPMFGEGFAHWDKVLSINLGGVVNGIVSFVPGMVARGRGHIVNTASFGAVVPAGGMFGIYTTSKYGVLGLSAALRDTLAKSGVGVTALCPGLVATCIATNSRRADPPKSADREAITSEAERIIATGIDPIVCGRMTVAAIRENAPYVFTHGEHRGEAAARFDELLACFPQTDVVAGALPFFHDR